MNKAYNQEVRQNSCGSHEQGSFGTILKWYLSLNYESFGGVDSNSDR